MDLHLHFGALYQGLALAMPIPPPLFFLKPIRAAQAAPGSKIREPNSAPVPAHNPCND